MAKSLILVIFSMILIACEGGSGGDFEPNNLISIADDEAAERERALLTGAPFVQSISLGGAATYDVGEKLVIIATFQKRTRIVNGGIPRIELDIGGVTRYADYVSGSGSQNFQFRFEYTIQAGDLDHDGVTIISPWDANGAEIEDYAEKEVGDFTFSVPDTSAYLVDTANLSVTAASTYSSGATTTLNISADNAATLYIGSDCLSGGSSVAYNTSVAANIFTNNNTNTFYVAAGNGSGGYSQCQTASVIHDNQAPNAVAGIAIGNDASDITSDSTSWGASSDNGPSGISHFEIAVSTTNAVGGIISPEGDWTNIGTNTSGNISNGATPWLAAVTDYYTLIRAVDNAGNISNVSASAAWQLAALSPEQITSMNVVEATNESIRVGWPYPDDNGFPITDYIVQYRLNGDSTWITINDGVSTSRRYTLEGLSAETEYDFRVRAYNGTNYGAWSPTLVAETLPNIDFVTFDYIAINIGGATKNALVSLEDDNEIYYGDNSASVYNDGSLISGDLDRGETLSIDADDFTVVQATKPFFIAGTLRSGGGDTSKANVVWATKSWIGKNFLFNHNRTNPMKVKVYAFTDSDVVVTKGGAAVAGGTVNGLLSENGHVFTISSYGSYEINSTGFIVAYAYANGGGSNYVDPKPLLPSSNDLVGVPSRDAKLSTDTPSTSYTAYHSNDQQESNTFEPGAVRNINQRGTSGLYQDEALRIRATAPIVANSYADANGSCSSPLVPVAFQKTKFAINVQAEWVAMASTNELTVTSYEPNGDGTFTTRTHVMTRVGSNNNTPTKQYETNVNFKAGTIFEGTAPFQMWYEPRGDNHATTNVPGGENNAADNDETIMFGWD
ncbi:MAG: hypothetical protein CME65_01905 [Halobacteriovoraceae bacterium]|nr:hypothetical protein [Halobacteriovoraceae bacterium]